MSLTSLQSSAIPSALPFTSLESDSLNHQSMEAEGSSTLSCQHSEKSTTSEMTSLLGRLPSVKEQVAWSVMKFLSLEQAVEKAFQLVFLLTGLSVRLLRYLGIGFNWISKLMWLIMYAALITPGCLQAMAYYFLSPNVKRNIRYGKAPRNMLDIYIPRDCRSDEMRPVVVFVTGGAWIIGYKGWGALLGQCLEENGIIVACLDYRNFPQGSVSHMMEDVTTGIGWVLANIQKYGGDPNRCYLVGQSAGAHLSATVVVTKAVVEAKASMSAAAATAAAASCPPSEEPEDAQTFSELNISSPSNSSWLGWLRASPYSAAEPIQEPAASTTRQNSINTRSRNSEIVEELEVAEENGSRGKANKTLANFFGFSSPKSSIDTPKWRIGNMPSPSATSAARAIPIPNPPGPVTTLTPSRGEGGGRASPFLGSSPPPIPNPPMPINATPARSPLPGSSPPFPLSTPPLRRLPSSGSLTPIRTRFLTTPTSTVLLGTPEDEGDFDDAASFSSAVSVLQSPSLTPRALAASLNRSASHQSMSPSTSRSFFSSSLVQRRTPAFNLEESATNSRGANASLNGFGTSVEDLRREGNSIALSSHSSQIEDASHRVDPTTSNEGVTATSSPLPHTSAAANHGEVEASEDPPPWPVAALRGFVGVSGIYNLVSAAPHFEDRGLSRSLFSTMMEGETSFAHFSPELMAMLPEFREAVGQGILPSMWLLHGTRDISIADSASTGFAATLRDAGAQAYCKLYKGKSHTDLIIQDPMRGGRDELIEDLLKIIDSPVLMWDPFCSAPQPRSAKYRQRMLPELILMLAQFVSPF